MGRKRKHDHEAILADYLAGMSTTEIASKYGCPGNLGCKLAKRRGVTRSPKVVERVNKVRSELANESHFKSPQGVKAANQRKRIVEYTKRHGLAAAAEKYGYSVGGLRHMAKQHGWNPARQRFDRQAILRDYLKGESLASLAKKYGCNLAYPSSLAIQAGVKRDKALIAPGRGRKRKQ